jgi:hypothetical protein
VRLPTSGYFATSPHSDIGEKLVAKIQQSESHEAMGRLSGVVHDAYMYYYGFDPKGFHATSAIHRGGEQGELAEFRVNHARALVNALKNLVTSQKFVWRPKAASFDAAAVREVELASNILEYYWTEKQVAAYFDIAVEQAIALTEGYVFAPWDDYAGEIIEEDPNRPGKYVMSGDICFYNVPWWDVIRDPKKPAWSSLDWVIVRVPYNRFDLAARYDDGAPVGDDETPLWQKILDAPSACGEDAKRTGAAAKEGASETDDVTCYYFYHRRGAALPKGREVVFLGDGTVLKDETLEYDDFPLYRVTPTELFGTPFGYSPFIEVMAIQELIDSLASTIATNQIAFGVQNVIVPQGSDISPEQLSGGLRVIYTPPGTQPPQALQLTATPKEVFDFFDILKSDQTRLFGLNDVVMGEAPGKDMSGSGMALLSQQALQQSSTLQGNSLRMAQALGSGILNTIRRRCWAPRQIDIVGKQNAFLVKPPEEFSGKSIGRITKVLVDIGNPMEQTPSGRFEIAQQMKQLGVQLNPDQIQQILTTGRMDPLTRGLQSELLNILSENEAIGDGQTPDAMLHDDHLLHCREHRIPANNPEARKNPAVLKSAMDHIHKHYQLYWGVPPMSPVVGPAGPVIGPDGQPAMQQDPMYRERLMILMGIQPPPPMGPPGMPPPGPGGPPPPGPGGPPPPNGPPPSGPPTGNEPVELPSMPTNPTTGQEWDPQTAGGAIAPAAH